MGLFEEIDRYTSDVADGLFAYVHTKQKAKNNLMKLMLAACVQYQKDAEFKAKVDAYTRLYL